MRVAVVGLGRMGSAIAERLLGAGHAVVVHNRSPDRAGPLVDAGAREVARDGVWEDADVAITMLTDSPALEDVALGDDGLLSPGGRGRTLIDMSTVSAETSQLVARAAEANGVAYLRAPVSGNPGVVRAGNLGIVASGSREVFDSAADLLRDIGPNVFYLGEGETARVMKLALNLMVAGTAQLLAEAVALGESHGIERATLLEVVGGSAVGSPFVKYKSGPLTAGDYSTTFSARLMRKDLDMALGSAAETGVPLPVTAGVAQLLQGCISTGMADHDFMALLPRLQREAGLPVDAVNGPGG